MHFKNINIMVKRGKGCLYKPYTSVPMPPKVQFILISEIFYLIFKIIGIILFFMNLKFCTFSRINDYLFYDFLVDDTYVIMSD